MVPLDKAGQMLRRPMHKEQAKALLEDVKGAAPDPRHWRHRYRHATRILVEGSVRQRAQLLGSFYALRSNRPLSFAEKKIHDDAERSILSELAFVLERDPEELTRELLKFFRENPPEPREPEENLTTPADANVKMPKQEAAEIDGWRYIGTFAVSGTVRLGDRSYLLEKKPKTRQQKLKDWASLDIKKGNWHTYQRDVEGDEQVVAIHSKAKFGPEDVTEEKLKVWVEGGDIGLIDETHMALPEVAENLAWEMSPAGTAFPWGFVAYTAVGDGAYKVHVNAGKSIGALRFSL